MKKILILSLLLLLVGSVYGDVFEESDSQVLFNVHEATEGETLTFTFTDNSEYKFTKMSEGWEDDSGNKFDSLLAAKNPDFFSDFDTVTLSYRNTVIRNYDSDSVDVAFNEFIEGEVVTDFTTSSKPSEVIEITDGGSPTSPPSSDLGSEILKLSDPTELSQTTQNVEQNTEAYTYVRDGEIVQFTSVDESTTVQFKDGRIGTVEGETFTPLTSEEIDLLDLPTEGSVEQMANKLGNFKVVGGENVITVKQKVDSEEYIYERTKKEGYIDYKPVEDGPPFIQFDDLSRNRLYTISEYDGSITYNYVRTDPNSQKDIKYSFLAFDEVELNTQTNKELFLISKLNPVDFSYTSETYYAEGEPLVFTESESGLSYYDEETSTIEFVGNQFESGTINVNKEYTPDNMNKVFSSEITNWNTNINNRGEDAFYGTITAQDGSETVYSNVEGNVYKKEYEKKGKGQSLNKFTVKDEDDKVTTLEFNPNNEISINGQDPIKVRNGKVQCPKETNCDAIQAELKEITKEFQQSNKNDAAQESREIYQQKQAQSFDAIPGVKGFTGYDVDLMVQTSQDFSAFSELFLSDETREEWRQTVDDIFFFEPATAVDNICEAKIDQPSQQVAYVELPSGDIGIGATAAVKCSRTVEPLTGETLNLYAITAYVNAPISIDRDHELKFNIYLENSTGKTYLYNETQVLERGNRLALTGDQTIVEYSTAQYEQICIEFNEPPRIIKTDLLCNKVVCTDAPIFDESPALTVGTAGVGDFGGQAATTVTNERKLLSVSCQSGEEYIYNIQPDIYLEEESSYKIFLNGEEELLVLEGTGQRVNVASTKRAPDFYSQACVQINEENPTCQEIQC